MKGKHAILILLVAALAFAPAARAQSGESSLSVLSAGPLTVSGEKGKDTAEAKFSILNASGAEVQIEKVSFQASSDERVSVVEWKPEAIPPGEAKRLVVTLSGVGNLSEEVTGQLVVKGGELPVSQALVVNPAAPNDPWPLILILGAFAIAALVALGVRRAVGSETLKEGAPDPKWSFSSWATTLTAAGAAFGVVLGQATYPPFPHHISKTELVNLNILFGLLLLVGPFLFEAIRRYTPAKRSSEDDEEPKREGSKWMLLVASSFTLWAVVGQIFALGLLGTELVDGFWEFVCVGAAIVFAVLGASYFVQTTRQQLETDWEKEAEEAKKAADKCCQPQPSSWSLL